MTTVTGTYLLPTGEPANGYVKFELCPQALDVDGAQRVCEPVYAMLDPVTGSFTIDLVPDADLVGVDGDAVYLVTEYVEACRRPAWYLHLADDTAVDLPSRYPGDANAPGAVLPLPGPQGPQGEVAVDSTITGARARRRWSKTWTPKTRPRCCGSRSPPGMTGRTAKG